MEAYVSRESAVQPSGTGRFVASRISKVISTVSLGNSSNMSFTSDISLAGRRTGGASSVQVVSKSDMEVDLEEWNMGYERRMVVYDIDGWM
jgi:hypothetical protein